MSSPAAQAPAAQNDAALQAVHQELARAIERVQRRGYVAGWRYGVVCGLLCGSLSTGLAITLLQVAAAAWSAAGG